MASHGIPMQFSYAALFVKHVYAYLNVNELKALKLLLTESPEIGAKTGGSSNTRGLDYCGCVVHYSYEPLFRTIYFWEIERLEWAGRHHPSFAQLIRNLLRR